MTGKIQKHLVVLVCLVFGISAYGAILVDEDFSSDPGWITGGMTGGNNPSRFGYNSSQQRIAEPGANPSNLGVYVRRNVEWDKYYTSVNVEITEQTAFTISGKIEIGARQNSGYVYSGAWNSSGTILNGFVGIYAWGGSSGTVRGRITKLDGTDIIPGGDLQVGSLSINTEYAFSMVYDVDTQTVTLTVGSSQDVYSLPNGTSFSIAVDEFGTSAPNISNHGANGGYTQEAGFDDLKFEVVPEPATIGLLLTGMYGLIRRR